LADLVTAIELDGLRADFDQLLGRDPDGNNADGVGTTIAITRVTSKTRGPINTTTLKYDDPTTIVIYTGPALISPVTFRRDRQEVAGGKAQRIRQYRCVVPWDSGDIHLDDNLEVITSQDPQFVAHGKKLAVSDVMYESEVAARRLTLIDISGTDDNC